MRFLRGIPVAVLAAAIGLAGCAASPLATMPEPTRTFLSATPETTPRATRAAADVAPVPAPVRTPEPTPVAAGIMRQITRDLGGDCLPARISLAGLIDRSDAGAAAFAELRGRLARELTVAGIDEGYEFLAADDGGPIDLVLHGAAYAAGDEWEVYLRLRSPEGAPLWRADGPIRVPTSATARASAPVAVPEPPPAVGAH